jgi:hypothetical protein
MMYAVQHGLLRGGDDPDKDMYKKLGENWLSVALENAKWNVLFFKNKGNTGGEIPYELLTPWERSFLYVTGGFQKVVNAVTADLLLPAAGTVPMLINMDAFKGTNYSNSAMSFRTPPTVMMGVNMGKFLYDFFTNAKYEETQPQYARVEGQSKWIGDLAKINPIGGSYFSKSFIDLYNVYGDQYRRGVVLGKVVREVENAFAIQFKDREPTDADIELMKSTIEKMYNIQIGLLENKQYQQGTYMESQVNAVENMWKGKGLERVHDRMKKESDFIDKLLKK